MSRQTVFTTRLVRPDELDRIAAFYRRNDYRPGVNPTDTVLVAEGNGVICGAARLCSECGALVLRGMMVSEEVRSQGVGTRLLDALETVIGDRECFCIPYRHLRSFYGHIGFIEVGGDEAPAFLRKRCAEYKRNHGLDVIIMRRVARVQPPKGADGRGDEGEDERSVHAGRIDA